MQPINCKTLSFECHCKYVRLNCYIYLQHSANNSLTHSNGKQSGPDGFECNAMHTLQYQLYVEQNTQKKKSRHYFCLDFSLLHFYYLLFYRLSNTPIEMNWNNNRHLFYLFSFKWIHFNCFPLKIQLNNVLFSQFEFQMHNENQTFKLNDSIIFIIVIFSWIQ